eukprot:g45479.t1
MKAANSQTDEQNVLGSSEKLERLREPLGSSPPSGVNETSESEMDMVDVAASMPLPPVKDALVHKRSGWRRQTMVQHTPPVSEAELDEPDLVQKRPRTGLQEEQTS